MSIPLFPLYYTSVSDSYWFSNISYLKHTYGHLTTFTMYYKPSCLVTAPVNSIAGCVVGPVNQEMNNAVRVYNNTYLFLESD